MKPQLQTALLTTILLLNQYAQAADTPLDDTFTSFARCDASFFGSLQSNARAWKAHASLSSANGISWIPVGNRASLVDNTVTLRGTPTLAGLKVHSYFDKTSEMGNLGYYLYWGFIIDAPLETSLKQLLPLVEHPERLRATRGLHVRSEVRVGNEWRATYDQGGVASGTRLLERVLILESETPGKTTVSCSLQGAVDAAVLEQLRPDIARADYPQPPATIRIEDVPLPVGVRDGLDEPLLTPRFTKLSYSYVSTKDGKPDTLPPTNVEMAVEDGLLNVTETYSPSFHVQRQTKAGLFQLKSLMSGSDGRVLLTQSFDLDIPKTWEPGATISAKAVMTQVPERRGDEPSNVTVSCRIGERSPASRVFASLQGDAVALNCSDKNSRSIRAFIEDLGIVLNLESSLGNSQYKSTISEFNVVR
ncbi:hypothetical protein [Xanthomonas sp. 10-10]|uniref:Secreted protein n=1 Tax=Xanthomonas sp. 10-10 TaxID=3115848 RepID=A0AAU7P4L1_9XANT